MRFCSMLYLRGLYINYGWWHCPTIDWISRREEEYSATKKQQYLGRMDLLFFVRPLLQLIDCVHRYWYICVNRMHTICFMRYNCLSIRLQDTNAKTENAADKSITAIPLSRPTAQSVARHSKQKCNHVPWIFNFISFIFHSVIWIFRLIISLRSCCCLHCIDGILPHSIGFFLFCVLSYAKQRDRFCIQCTDASFNSLSILSILQCSMKK